MVSPIEEELINTEHNNSLFEAEVRKLPLLAYSIFKKGNQVAPADFKETKIALNSCNEPSFKEAFSDLLKSPSVILEAVKSLAPPILNKRVAVLFSGGPAAGGHNVILGIKNVLGKDNILYGIKGGPKGLLDGNLFEIKDEDLNRVTNLGGFDFLGSDRTKIKSKEQFEKVREVVKKFHLNGLIIIGGDDSNTNAAFLAEYLYADGCAVVGVPKTIDGDLQIGAILPISFGFDTATKVYAELVGNILQDTPSSRKYWHFIKLMGRSASHVALEVALQTKPAITFISEEVEEAKITLSQIIDILAKTILARAAKSINHGAVLVPEGLIEFIPDLKDLIKELNDLFGKYQIELDKLDLAKKVDFASGKLTNEALLVFNILPFEIKKMLVMDRDSHGNLQVSKIPTESLLIEMVEKRISEIQADPKKIIELNLECDREDLVKVQEFRFNHISHFFGYEGRCGVPTKFDATYTYNLGLIAGSLAIKGKTGYMAAFTDLASGGKALAIPLAALLNSEIRQGKEEFVIEKALVKTNSPAFQFFKERRDAWAKEDCFASPGPRQLWGPTANQMPFTVILNQGYQELDFTVK